MTPAMICTLVLQLGFALAVLTLLLEHLTARGLKCVSLAQACSLS